MLWRCECGETGTKTSEDSLGKACDACGKPMQRADAPGLQPVARLVDLRDGSEWTIVRNNAPGEWYTRENDARQGGPIDGHEVRRCFAPILDPRDVRAAEAGAVWVVSADSPRWRAPNRYYPWLQIACNGYVIGEAGLRCVAYAGTTSAVLTKLAALRDSAEPPRWARREATEIPAAPPYGRRAAGGGPARCAVNAAAAAERLTASDELAKLAPPPIYKANDSDFGGRSSLTFDGSAPPRLVGHVDDTKRFIERRDACALMPYGSAELAKLRAENERLTANATDLELALETSRARVAALRIERDDLADFINRRKREQADAVLAIVRNGPQVCCESQDPDDAP